MPEQAKRSENVRGHRTKREMEAKRNAESMMTQETGEKPVMPSNVKRNTAAKSVWKRTIKSLENMHLLARADSDILARYCIVTATIEELELQGMALLAAGATDEYKNTVTLLNTLNRTALSFAEKLGLTPQGRARLAVKIAREEIDEDEELFGD